MWELEVSFPSNYYNQPCQFSLWKLGWELGHDSKTTQHWSWLQVSTRALILYLLGLCTLRWVKNTKWKKNTHVNEKFDKVSWIVTSSNNNCTMHFCFTCWSLDTWVSDVQISSHYWIVHEVVGAWNGISWIIHEVQGQDFTTCGGTKEKHVIIFILYCPT
jgi:hypothetical protein